MDKVDLVVHARWVVPVEPRGRVLERHAVVVHDGQIKAVLPSAEAENLYTADQRVDCPDHALMPGLINAHTHAAMTLFRGMADDMHLEEWLEQHIWPAEARWAGVDFVRDGSELAILEMVTGGTTCFQDMYFFPDVVAQAAVERRMRAVVGMIFIDQPTVWARNNEEYFSKGLAVHDQFLNNSLVQTNFAPHAPYTVSNETFERMRILADELDVQIHIHLHETESEVQTAVATHGQRPIERMNELGLLTASLNAVHMTQLTDAEISLVAEQGVSVVHCPQSNLKLASGFCPVARLLAAGINIALGTDGAGSNNDLDMFGEMRTAALLAKGVAGDAAVVSAEDALAMATINGARALGLAHEIGSLQAGKSADMIAVDFNTPASQPVYHPISQLVYSVSRDQVSDVWVAGQPIIQDRRLCRDNQAQILERAAAWQQRLSESDA